MTSLVLFTTFCDFSVQTLYFRWLLTFFLHLNSDQKWVKFNVMVPGSWRGSSFCPRRSSSSSEEAGRRWPARTHVWADVFNGSSPGFTCLKGVRAGHISTDWLNINTTSLTSKSGMLGSLNSCQSLRGMTSTGTSWVTTLLMLDRVGWTGQTEDVTQSAGSEPQRISHRVKRKINCFCLLSGKNLF